MKVLLAACLLGSTHAATETVCENTLCSWNVLEDGSARTRISSSKTAGENFKCGKVEDSNECVCMCRDEFECTMDHARIDGTRTERHHCDAVPTEPVVTFLLQLKDQSTKLYWDWLMLNENTKDSQLEGMNFGGLQFEGSDLIGISLSDKKIEGTLPDISKLTKMEYLYLHNNKFTGTLPDFSKNTKLNSVNLYSNGGGLYGPFPDISSTEMTSFKLYGEQLTGTIPDLSNLPDLTTFQVNNNQLSGPMPDISNNPKLKDMRMNDNKLTGTISDMSQNPAMRLAFLGNNKLTGTIANFLNNPELYSFSAFNNDLTGTIPSLATCPILSHLSLSGNELTGTIPDFAENPLLSVLYLQNNQLTGTIPDFSSKSALKLFYATRNQLVNPEVWEADSTKRPQSLTFSV